METSFFSTMNTKKIQPLLLHFILYFIFLSFQCYCWAWASKTDTISPGSVLKYPDTITSHSNVFKLGFFRPANTTNYYLGVFYAFSEEKVVWVANRDRPLNEPSAAVTISEDGNLVLTDGRNRTVWSTNATAPAKTSVQIMDTGNLVLREDATGATIWESFSHPTNVYLPTMKITHNIRTGKKVLLSSWMNESDPRVGRFTSGIEASYSYLTQSITRKDGRSYWRSGPWNGLYFIGVKENYFSYAGGFTYLKNDSADDFYYMAPKQDLLINEWLNSSGSLMRMEWNVVKKNMDVVWSAPAHDCDVYGMCGQFGSCDIHSSPICSCLKGFEPRNESEWERGNWSSGCRRMTPLQCDAAGGKNADRFLKLEFMKVPDFAMQFSTTKEDECRDQCVADCSCVAYARDSNIGCMLWNDSLIDIQKFESVGVDLFVRLSSSELDNQREKRRNDIIPQYVIILVVVGFTFTSIFVFLACRRWMPKRKGDTAIAEVGPTFSSDSTAIVLKDESEKVNIGELPQFTFEILANATDQFHENNLLGRGGFGPVYKGVLGNGKEIAVQRLCEDSGQGVAEFMNEVIVISRVQHRNLVKLLGGCVEKEEKILVYEYMPNKSLDICLFDPTHRPQKILEWGQRFGIIEGIGRGLLYLHRDSRLRIIHRDLKPSNVLLDEDWKPKISDFGMARIFGRNQDHGNTARVVGTYGYMAPEYALEGRFSEKSDVFSLGVLMLEIVKGEKNTRFYNRHFSLSLLGFAWKSWSEGNGMGFADERIAHSDLEEEIERCIQIGLLCVQEFPKDRPTVQTVLSMLCREIVDLPPPAQPIFAEKWNGNQLGIGYSINDLTISALHAR